MSKEPKLELKQNVVKKFKASTASNPTNKIFINLKLTRFTRLLVMSELFRNKNMRHSVDYNKINFNTEVNAYKLDDATYIGTVGSTITDMSMDIYYIQEVVEDENQLGVNIGYFVAFPTLLLIPNVQPVNTKVVELEAIVFGVEENMPIMRSTSLEIPTGKSVYAYLKNITLTAPNKIANKLITFPGLDEDSPYTVTEVYTIGGQCNGDKTQPNQYLDLGPINTLITGFDPVAGINIDISNIKQTTHKSYAYGESEKVNMKLGNLCIPLNF
jgi:hypothetical protein